MHPIPLRNNVDVDTSAALFDYRLIFLWTGFIIRSVKRHPFAALSSFAVLLVLLMSVVFVIPPKYHVEAVLLSNRNSMLASLGNPSRNVSADVEGPTQAARETVMAHKNLLFMVQELQLVEHWQEVRNPALKLKDRLQGFFAKPPSEEDRIDGMVDILERRLVVYSGANGTVTIEVFWPEAAMARRIVETAQRNFLEARHLAEVSAISEVISILESHIANNESTIEQSMSEMEKAVEERRSTRRGRTSSSPAEPRVARAAPKPSSETANSQALAQLRYSIRTRARALEDLEEFRNRRITELQNQLREQRTIYGPSYPSIRDIEQRIHSTRVDTPQMNSLRREIEQLTNEYRNAGGRDPETDSIAAIRRSGSVGGTGRASTSELLDQLSELDDDPSVLVAREKLQMAVANLQEFQMRLNSARIELDAARAAFEYRYNIVKPAQMPKRAMSPNRPLIAMAGLMMGAFMAIFICFLFDFLSGRVVEAWQIEQRLKLPVLSKF